MIVMNKPLRGIMLTLLAQFIVKSNPKIEAVFNQWKSTDALLSNLEKNQELKSILISETPWLRDAQSER